MTTRITPTPGRIIWYWPGEADGIAQIGRGTSKAEPLAAIVAGVLTESLLNLCVIDAYGNSQARTNVQLVQEDDVQTGGSFATWMPYQLGQAAKTEEVLEQANDVSTQPETTDEVVTNPTEPEEAPQA